MLKTAIVHEWLVNYAGSERCVESFNNLYPGSDIYTLVDFLNNDERNVVLKGKQTNTSFIQKLPFAKKKHRNYLPLFPFAIEQFDLSEYQLIISSSHAVAKGALTFSNQLHICYCHTPIRYAWDLQFRYLKEAGLEKGIKSLMVKRTLHKIRQWDVATANRPDFYIANSNHIAKRIKKIYNREAAVIYPPVDVDKFTIGGKRDNFYLTASRMVPYKRLDLIVDTFNEMPDKKLVVIGHGPEKEKIKNKAKQNIELIDYQPPEKLKEFMRRAKAFVFAAEEDFGIIVVEAMACGTPVIAWNYGGTAESVIDGETGIHFDEQNKESIKAAVNKFEKQIDKFDPEIVRAHSLQFSRKVFEEKIKAFIDEKAEEFFLNR